jgi:dihydrofolate reductase
MSKVVLELSVSPDGFVTGPEVSPEAHLGRGGERLHEWMFAGKSAVASQNYETAHFSGIGALIMGRRMADLGIGPWGEEPTSHAPCFVVTHRPAEAIVKKGGTAYAFITEGIEAARISRGSSSMLACSTKSVCTSPRDLGRRHAVIRRGSPPGGGTYSAHSFGGNCPACILRDVFVSQ